MAHVACRREHRLQLAVEDQAQELGGLGAPRAASSVVKGERARAVGGEGGGEGLAGRMQGAELPVQVGGLGARLFDQALEEAGAPLQGPADQRQEDVVDVEPAPRQPLAPAGVEAGGEALLGRVREGRRHPAADHVVIEGEARRGGAAQHGLADRLAVVQLLVRRGLGGEAGQVQGLDQEAVAGLQGDVVDMAGVGQAVADAGLARRERLGDARGHIAVVGRLRAHGR